MSLELDEKALKLGEALEAFARERFNAGARGSYEDVIRKMIEVNNSIRERIRVVKASAAAAPPPVPAEVEISSPESAAALPGKKRGK